MDDYFIHPSVKVLEIKKPVKIKFSKKLNCDFRNTEFSLAMINHIARGQGFNFEEDYERPFDVVFETYETSWLYEIDIEDSIVIKASSELGVFKAIQTVIKFINKYTYMFQGTIKDLPSLEERGFHLDCARKYFPKDWILTLIKRLSWMGFNTLELHFSENMGLRLETLKFPYLLSKQYLSGNDLLEIMTTAKQYHISIIPSLDSPGHLRYILKKLPKLSLPGSENEALDISNPLALQFIRDFYGDYSDNFRGQKYFNLGADEFIDFETFESYPMLEAYAKDILKIKNGTGYDTYIHYINEMVKFLENKGFIVRLWNDGLLRLNQNSNIELSKTVEICYWTKYNQYMAPLSSFETRAYTLLNYHAENFYYTLHPEGGIKIIDPKLWYNTWNPTVFSFNQIAVETTQVKGAFYSLWCDAPELQTSEEIMTCLMDPLMAFSQLTWSGDNTLSLELLRKEKYVYGIK